MGRKHGPDTIWVPFPLPEGDFSDGTPESSAKFDDLTYVDIDTFEADVEGAPFGTITRLTRG